MKKILLLLTLVLAAEVMASAQTKAYGNEPEAERMVRQAIANLKKSAYASRFTIDYYSEVDKSTDSKVGKVDLKGSAFHLELYDTEIRFNGKTQWTYVAADNEVTITQPSKADLKESNPMSLIDATLEDNRVAFSEKRRQAGSRIINCFPYEPKKVEYFKIVLYIDELNQLPRKIIIHQRNGDRVTMSFLDLHKISFVPSNYVFNKAEYPKVTVNDLR